MDGWMDGWMDFEDGEDGGGRRERESRRVSMTRIGYLPHASKSGKFQSPTGDAS